MTLDDHNISSCRFASCNTSFASDRGGDGGDQALEIQRSGASPVMEGEEAESGQEIRVSAAATSEMIEDSVAKSLSDSRRDNGSSHEELVRDANASLPELLRAVSRHPRRQADAVLPALSRLLDLQARLTAARAPLGGAPLAEGGTQGTERPEGTEGAEESGGGGGGGVEADLLEQEFATVLSKSNRKLSLHILKAALHMQNLAILPSPRTRGGGGAGGAGLGGSGAGFGAGAGGNRRGGSFSVTGNLFSKGLGGDGGEGSGGKYTPSGARPPPSPSSPANKQHGRAASQFLFDDPMLIEYNASLSARTSSPLGSGRAPGLGSEGGGGSVGASGGPGPSLLSPMGGGTGSSLLSPVGCSTPQSTLSDAVLTATASSSTNTSSSSIAAVSGPLESLFIGSDGAGAVGSAGAAAAAAGGTGGDGGSSVGGGGVSGGVGISESISVDGVSSIGVFEGGGGVMKSRSAIQPTLQISSSFPVQENKFGIISSNSLSLPRSAAASAAGDGEASAPPPRITIPPAVGEWAEWLPVAEVPWLRKAAAVVIRARGKPHFAALYCKARQATVASAVESVSMKEYTAEETQAMAWADLEPLIKLWIRDISILLRVLFFSEHQLIKGVLDASPATNNSISTTTSGNSGSSGSTVGTTVNAEASAIANSSIPAVPDSGSDLVSHAGPTCETPEETPEPVPGELKANDTTAHSMPHSTSQSTPENTPESSSSKRTEQVVRKPAEHLMSPDSVLRHLVGSVGGVKSTLCVLCANAAAIAASKSAPEKIFALLEAYRTVADLSPQALPVFLALPKSDSDDPFKLWQRLSQLFAGAIFATLDDLNRILRDVSAFVPANQASGSSPMKKKLLRLIHWKSSEQKATNEEEVDIGVHKVTSYVINFIAQLMDRESRADHYGTLEMVYKRHAADKRLIGLATIGGASFRDRGGGGGGGVGGGGGGGKGGGSSGGSKTGGGILGAVYSGQGSHSSRGMQGSQASQGSQSGGRSGGQTSQGSGQTSQGGSQTGQGGNQLQHPSAGGRRQLAAEMEGLLDSLLFNMEARGRAIQDPAMGALFVMNNAHYVAGSIVATRMKDALKQQDRIAAYEAAFDKAGLAKLMACLAPEEVSAKLSADAVKSRLKKFNSAFEEVALEQNRWIVISDSQRKKTRIRFARTLKNAYLEFLTPHREIIADIPTYQWSPDGIERLMLKSFFLATGTFGSFHCYFFPLVSPACEHEADLAAAAAAAANGSLPRVTEESKEAVLGSDQRVVVFHGEPYNGLRFEGDGKEFGGGSRGEGEQRVVVFHGKPSNGLRFEGDLVGFVGEGDDTRQRVHWWRAQSIRFLLRSPSAYLCHITNRVRHTSYGLSVAARLAASAAQQAALAHSHPNILSSLRAAAPPCVGGDRSSNFVGAAIADIGTNSRSSDGVFYVSSKGSDAENPNSSSGNSSSNSTGNTDGGNPADNPKLTGGFPVLDSVLNGCTLASRAWAERRRLSSCSCSRTDSTSVTNTTVTGVPDITDSRFLNYRPLALGIEPYVPRPIVSVHVRQGDKGSEMRLNSFPAFMFFAYRLRRVEPDLKHVWLSTEMQSVIDQATRFKNWSFLYSHNLRQSSNKHMVDYERDVGHQLVGISFANLIISSQCDYFVGALGSNWNSAFSGTGSFLEAKHNRRIPKRRISGLPGRARAEDTSDASDDSDTPVVGTANVADRPTTDGPLLRPRSVSIPFGDREITVEVGRMGRQANGAVTVTDGETVLYCTVCASEEESEPSDFVPLSVSYQERFSAGGRTSGGYFKREGRPKDHEILVSRLIDRPLRPMVAKGFNHEVQVLSWLLSYDGEHSPDALAITSAGAALAVSDIPLAGIVAGVRVGMVNGALVVNPSNQQLEGSPLDLVVAGTTDSVLMIEGYCNLLSEEQLLEAVAAGQRAISAICHGLHKWTLETEGVAKPKLTAAIHAPPADLLGRLEGLVGPDLEKALRIEGKKQRGVAMKAIEEKVLGALTEAGQAATRQAGAGGSHRSGAGGHQADEQRGGHRLWKVGPELSHGSAGSLAGREVEGPLRIEGKKQRGAAMKAIEAGQAATRQLKELTSRIMRRIIVTEGRRSDGRGTSDVRPIESACSVLPRVHGSALFTRGETQALAVATLGGEDSAQRLDHLTATSEFKRFYLQ
ncbi:unnamed protein product, partial [Closterium sp. Yama58-4]